MKSPYTKDNSNMVKIDDSNLPEAIPYKESVPRIPLEELNKAEWKHNQEDIPYIRNEPGKRIAIVFKKPKRVVE